MNKFELVLIYNPELSNSKLSDQLKFIKNLIIDKSGKIVNEENWGLRDLSYSIKKFKKAFYTLLQLEISGNAVKDLNNQFNQSDDLLRYIFIKVEKHQELPSKLNHEKK